MGWKLPKENKKDGVYLVCYEFNGGSTKNNYGDRRLVCKKTLGEWDLPSDVTVLFWDYLPDVPSAIRDRIIDCAELSCSSYCEITEDSLLMNDLFIDSLEIVVLHGELEIEFGIKIDYIPLTNKTTIKDLIVLVSDCLKI